MPEPAPKLREILALTRQLAALHRELGIPARYALDRRLEPHVEAAGSDLVEIGASPNRQPVRLTHPTANAWRKLQAAAAADGVTLIPLSGFRSIARQAEIIREKLHRGRTLDDILRSNVAPGFSEHHTGRAIDIGTPGCPALTEEFGATAAFRWLEQHALRFGFRLSYRRDNPHGLVYEPWHWCWCDA